MSRVYQPRAAAPRATATSRPAPAARSPQRPRPTAPATGGAACRGGTARPTPCRAPRPAVPRDPYEDNVRPNPTERTVRAGDGFQIFTPSNEKREQMRRQADDEQRRYEAHVERTRLRGIHEVHRLGGAALTEEEVRQQQAENYRREKFARLEKAHQNQLQKKSEEDKEIEEKKQAARTQALKNLERDRRTTDDAREEDRKETMDRFLNRLAQQTNNMTLDSEQTDRDQYGEQLKILRELFPHLDDETLRSRLEIYEGNIEMIVQEFTE